MTQESLVVGLCGLTKPVLLLHRLPVVSDHPTSIILERKARFKPLGKSNIPTMHYNFAAYELLKNRIKENKLLTDYIGRMEKNLIQPTGTTKTLRKALLQETR